MTNPQSPARRKFLEHAGATTAATIAAGAVGVRPLLDPQTSGAMAQSNAGASHASTKRSRAACNIRINAAEANRKSTPKKLAHETNMDDASLPNYIGNYTKGLPHDANGEVVPSAYAALVTALDSGRQEDFALVPLGGDRKFTSPQSGYAFDMEGMDGQSFVQPPPPAFRSREIGAEIAENYWMALLRDVPFTEYGASPIAAAAAADLTAFGVDFRGAKTNVGGGTNNGVVTPELLFRGLTPGDKTGPLMSQFWYHPCWFGANRIDQRIRTLLGAGDGGRDYMTDFATYLDVQRGFNQMPDLFDPVLRYVRNGRDLSQWVHIDVLFQGYFQAFLVIAGLGAPVDDGNPYKVVAGNPNANPASSNQAAFATFGGPYIATLLCEVATRALKAVWYQKWMVHRRLRPEAFAARIHRRLYDGATGYPVDTEILNSINTNTRLGGYLTPGNALLPVAFPEGSPTHPAYGAGHATVAGACVTILKAYFDESFVIPDPVVPSADGLSLVPYTGRALTVGGELNKIASNVANGRNMAGVHWRSDAAESLKLGEAVAISILKDQRGLCNETFNGYTLTKFDGTTITV